MEEEVGQWVRKHLWSHIIALSLSLLGLFCQRRATLAASAQALQQQQQLLSEGQTRVESSGNDRQRVKTPPGPTACLSPEHCR